MKVRITKVPDKKQDSQNARKWHGDGGLLDKFSSVYGNDRARMLDAIRKIRQK